MKLVSFLKSCLDLHFERLTLIIVCQKCLFKTDTDWRLLKTRGKIRITFEAYNSSTSTFTFLQALISFLSNVTNLDSIRIAKSK